MERPGRRAPALNFLQGLQETAQCPAQSCSITAGLSRRPSKLEQSDDLLPAIMALPVVTLTTAAVTGDAPTADEGRDMDRYAEPMPQPWSSVSIYRTPVGVGSSTVVAKLRASSRSAGESRSVEGGPDQLPFRR